MVDYYLGIDCGSSVTKAVLMKGNEIVAYNQCPTAHRPKQAMTELLNELTAHLRPEEFKVITTGYGRDLLEHSQSVTEITCHAIGAHYLGSQIGTSVRTVIDIGGQDVKVIALDRDGMVVDFLMNDKCAAGTGRFVEVLMGKLGERIETIDQFVSGALPVKISSMCTVFAESEVIGLLATDVKAKSIALGIVHAIGERTSHFAQRITLEETLFFTGGLAKCAVLKDCLEFGIGKSIYTHDMSQYAGAIGAALIGQRRKRERRR